MDISQYIEVIIHNMSNPNHIRQKRSSLDLLSCRIYLSPNNFFHSHSTTIAPITQKIKFFKYPAPRSCTLNSEPMKAPTQLPTIPIIRFIQHPLPSPLIMRLAMQPTIIPVNIGHVVNSAICSSIDSILFFRQR